MEVKECIKSLYSQLPLENDTDVGDGIFYEFINKRFEALIGSVNQIDVDSLQGILKSDNAIAHFVEPYTKLRFINCMKKICKDFLQILALCYKGNLTDADRALKKLLRSRCYGKYLVEDYIELLSFCLEKGKEYYRMRDEDKCDAEGNELIVDNCWHVPYEKRAFAFSGRYNLLGYPCLYLGDSEGTCEAELGQLEKDRRWVGVFGLRKDILLYDLRIPSEETIDRADGYDLFRMLQVYPLVASCTVKSRRKGFNEEYFIPQLLFHRILMAGNKATSHKGIAYSSTKHKGGYNIVLPALYPGKEPPANGYSKMLLEMFEPQVPKIYKSK